MTKIIKKAPPVKIAEDALGLMILLERCLAQAGFMLLRGSVLPIHKTSPNSAL